MPYLAITKLITLAHLFKNDLPTYLFFKANCIDRHTKQNPSKTALIWEQDEPGKQTTIF